VSTFYTSIEPFFDLLKKEDLSFLEYTGDEVEPYIVPRLGQHYSKQREDEDIFMYDPALPTTQVIRSKCCHGELTSVAPVLR
jgi:transcriptional adapter 3